MVKEPVILDDVESLSPQGSNTVHSAIPITELRPTRAKAEGDSSRPKGKFSAQDKGKKVVKGSGETSPQSYEKVYQRRICPHRASRTDLVTHLNRASRNLVSERDMEYLNRLPPVERIKQARFSAADVSYLFTLV